MLSKFIKKYHWQIEEYFKSPFIWWGIALFVINLLADYSFPVEQFRTLLWVYNFHWAFFIPSFAFSIIITLNVHVDGLVFLIIKRRKISSIIILATLCVILLTESVSYYTGIISLIGYTYEETILNLENFEQLILYSSITGFFAIPLLFIYTKRNIRNVFSKENLNYNVLKWDRIIPRLWMIFILLLISLWILNLYVWNTLS